MATFLADARPDAGAPRDGPDRLSRSPVHERPPGSRRPDELDAVFQRAAAGIVAVDREASNEPLEDGSQPQRFGEAGGPEDERRDEEELEVALLTGVPEEPVRYRRVDQPDRAEQEGDTTHNLPDEGKRQPVLDDAEDDGENDQRERIGATRNEVSESARTTTGCSKGSDGSSGGSSSGVATIGSFFSHHRIKTTIRRRLAKR